MSERTADVHARVLHLHRHLAAVVQLRAVDLADRGGGDRLLVELGERLLQRLAHLLLDHLAHVLEGHLRRGVAQLGELLLELLAVVLGHQADVEEREHLAELHRGALHRAEHLHDLLGGLDVALLERRGATPPRSAPRSPSSSRPASRRRRRRRGRPSPAAGTARWGCPCRPLRRPLDQPRLVGAMPTSYARRPCRRVSPGSRATSAAPRSSPARAGCSRSATTARCPCADVAREAGVTRGLLHHYFGTKRELYLEVVRCMVTPPPALLEDMPAGDRRDGAVATRSTCSSTPCGPTARRGSPPWAPRASVAMPRWRPCWRRRARRRPRG